MAQAVGRYTEANEPALMRWAGNGDSAAFGELVKRHMHRGYRAALGLVGSHDDALDLSQDAFARALNHAEKMDPDRPFYPWFYFCATGRIGSGYSMKQGDGLPMIRSWGHSENIRKIGCIGRMPGASLYAP